MTTLSQRVLLLTDSDVFAGTERHIVELAGGLREVGVEAMVGCPAKGVLAARAAAAGFEVVSIEKRAKLDVLAVLALVRGLRRGRFGIVHTHNGRTAFLAALALTLARRGRLVVTEHFLAPSHSHLRGWWAFLPRRVHRWIAGRACKVIAISQSVRASILERRAAPPEKVAVVLNGIAAPLAADLIARPEVRAAFGIGALAPLVIAVARLEKEKGLDTLVRAMGEVVRAIPDVRCLLVGEGAERPKLERLVAAQGLTGKILLPGFRPDVPSLMAASDVFVLPSPAEPFGLALLEAMAVGVPAVASRAGGPLEIVEDGRTGLLVPPEDAAGFAAAIVRVLQDPAWAAEAGERARQRFTESFSARRMSAQMKDVYEDCR